MSISNNLLQLRNLEGSEPLTTLSSQDKVDLNGVFALQPEDSPIHKLSNRELTCFRMLIKAHTIDDISQTLGVAIPTIANYISRLKRKLNCTNRSEMVKLAETLGLVKFHI